MGIPDKLCCSKIELKKAPWKELINNKHKNSTNLWKKVNQ